VKETTPFLPGISPKLGRAKRRQLEAIRLLREQLRSKSIADIGALFGKILPPECLIKSQRDIRQRIFPESITFWAWTSQLLQRNESCAAALTSIQGWYDRAGIQAPAFDTSSFCRARQRLSGAFLQDIKRLIERYDKARVEPHHLWYGCRLKAIDGTSVRLMDTDANQKKFPQPSGQKPGCGFPVMGVTGILNLATGTMDRFLTARDRQHDAQGLYLLSEHLLKMIFYSQIEPTARTKPLPRFVPKVCKA